MQRRPFLKTLIGGLVGATQPALSFAQNVYPDRPIKFINAFPAGGPSDIFIRAFTQRLSAVLNTPIVVDNRVGAGGAIGGHEAARAKPDGYTLQVATSSSLIIYPVSVRKPLYDPIKDFTPIAALAKLSATICVPASLPVNTLSDFIALLKANPEKYSYGSAGIGSFVHLAAELFKKQLGVDSLHVPYKGSAPAMQALVSGQIAWLCDVPSTSLPFYEAGKIKILALCDTERSQALPRVPTTVEQGFPEMLANTYNFFVAPAGISAVVGETLNAAAMKVMRQKEFTDQLRAQGVVPILDTTPAQTKDLIRIETARWTPIGQANMSD